jgi:hypothetical protein
MTQEKSSQRGRSSASDEAAFARIEEAMEALETFLAMANNHPNALPIDKRTEIKRRLDNLRLKIAARDIRGQ